MTNQIYKQVDIYVKSRVFQKLIIVVNKNTKFNKPTSTNTTN